MRVKKIVCSQCGAVLKPGVAYCPYCGSAYAPEAEREYMRKLHRIKEDLDDVGDTGAIVSKNEAGKVGRKVVVTVGVILFIAALIAGIAVYFNLRETQKNHQEYAWRAENLPEMERLYEEGKYDELVTAFQKARQDGHDLYSWKHFTFCQIWEETVYTDQALTAREQGYFYEPDASGLLYHELVMRGLPYRRGLTEKERKILEEKTAEYQNDLREIFGASEEEIASIDSMLQEKNGYPDYSFCKDYLSGHPDIYKPMPDEAR